MNISRLNLKKIFGDYFFLLLLLVGIGVNYYFEMKVNRSIKMFTANHQAIMEFKELEGQVRDLGDQLKLHEEYVRQMMVSGDTTLINKIGEEEKIINRDAVLLTQHFHDLTQVDNIVNFRSAIQDKLEFEHQVIEANQSKDKARAWDLLKSDKLVQLHKNYTDRSEKLMADIRLTIAQRNEQLKKDKVDIISLDYAIPHLTSFIFLVIAGFTVFKIMQVSRLNKNMHEAMSNEKKAQELKDQFMDTITHELRSPLNSVLGYTNLLLKTKLDTDQHKYVKSIRTSGELLLNVINEVLDYSKIRSGYIRIASNPFNFREQMTALADIVRDKINEKNLEFNIDIADDIPDHLKGDNVKLLQVLLNLTYNAVKFTNEGSISVQARCKEKKNDRVLLEISVADTGIGMPQDKLPRIFDRFYQVEGNGAKNAAGTGLGLSITKEMLMMQGGSITVESELGKGSVFHVIIPYEVMEEDPEDVPSVLSGSSASHKLPSAMKVLVVDDNALNRDMLSCMLDTYGVAYKVAQNGPEAIRLLGQDKFDVVLMDLQMPGMDGKMTTRKIREELGSDVPIVALSAYAEVAEKQNCLAAGMDAYLSKPVKEEELYETLEFYTPQSLESGGLDLEYLKKVASGNAEFIESVVLRVAESLPKEITELRDALIENDQHKVNVMAHDMKTTFAVLGVYEQLEEPLRYLESWQSSPRSIAEAGEMLHRIEGVANDVIVQLLEAFAKPGEN